MSMSIPYDCCFKYSIRHVASICSLRSPAEALSCFHLGQVCLLILSRSLCLCVLVKSAMSPVFEGFMRKRSSSALLCSVPFFPGPDTFAVVSNVCYVCSALLSWMVFPSRPLICRGFLPVVGSIWSLAQM